LLGAVDDVAVALLHRAGLQVGGVRTRLWLGQAEGADMFGRRQLPQPAVLLGVRPEIVDDDAGRGVVHADHRGDRAVTRGDLLQQQGIGDRVDLAAVPLRRGGRAEYAEFTQFTDDLRLDAQVLFALGGQRGQPLLREAADHVDDEGIAVWGNAVGHGGPPGVGAVVYAGDGGARKGVHRAPESGTSPGLALAPGNAARPCPRNAGFEGCSSPAG